MEVVGLCLIVIPTSPVSNSLIVVILILQLFVVLGQSVEVTNCTHGSIRLVGGRRPTMGRVEICVHNVWGSVCDDGWNRADANVACGQLGYFPSSTFSLSRS